jgi:Bacterial membrane protein YfhO
VRTRLSFSWRGLLALAVLVLALFRDIVFGGRVLFDRDIHFYWFGQIEVFRQCIAAGSWPVWDRTIAFGQPMLANPSVEALYPWTWISLVVGTWSFFTIFVIGHLFLSAIGFFRLARRFGVGDVGAAVAAAVWITSGPMMSFVNLWHHFAGAALIPWVVLATDIALRSSVLRGALVWGAAVGLQLLAGSADMCVLTGFLMTALVLGRAEWRRPFGPTNKRILVTAAGAAILAVALGAGQWFPSLAVASQSLRLGRLAESVRTYWSVHPRAVLGLLLPIFPRELPPGGDPGLEAEAARPFVASLYLGLTSLPLALAAFGGERRRLASICGAITVFALMVALGRHTFVYPLAVRLLPPLGSLRYPSKVMVLVAFGWAALVALGLERLQAGDGRARPRAALVALGLGILAAALAVAARTSLSVILAPACVRLGAAAGLSFLMAALCGWGRRRGVSPALAAGLGLLATADLFVAHQALNPTVPAAEVARPPQVVAAMLSSPAPRRVFVFDYYDIVGKRYRRPGAGSLMAMHDDPVSRLEGNRDYGTASVARAWGISGSFENDPFGLYSGSLTQLAMMFRVWEDTPAFLKALRMGNVGHVIALHSEGLEELAPEAVVYSTFAVPIRLFRVPDPLPRCQVVAAGPVAADNHQSFVILGDPRFDPAREVILPPGTVPVTVGTPVHGDCRIVDYRPDRGRFEVELDAPGYVVLADTYAPGWRATLDGGPVAIVRGNVAFQAVAAPEGKHVLELIYRPQALVVGLWVSAFAWLLVVAGSVWVRVATYRRSAIP